MEEGVDGDGGHVVGVMVLHSAGRGLLRAGRQDGVCRLNTDTQMLQRHQEHTVTSSGNLIVLWSLHLSHQELSVSLAYCCIVGTVGFSVFRLKN